MGDPISMALLGAGTAISAGGSIVKGIQESKMASYNAKVYENEAEAIKAKAVYDEKMQQADVKRFIGTQRAGYGASGVALGAGGSPETVVNQTALQGMMDAIAIRYGGDVAAIQAKNQAALAKWQSRNYLSSGLFGAGATLLSGAGQIYGLR